MCGGFCDIVRPPETEQMSMQKSLRVGVIGVGNMGLHHARVYSQLDHVILRAVADSDAARAGAVAARFGVNAYTNYCEMLEREQLDAVTVAVPTREHLAVALEVIGRGIALLVEKPLAANFAQAEQITQTAERAGVALAVGHIERFNPAIQELRRRVQNGSLGNISSVIARRVGVMPPQVRDADVIVDLAVHDIDVLNYFFEMTPRVVHATAGYALLTNRYDHAEIFLQYGNAGCFVQVNWITPLKVRTLSVTGDGGHAELNYVTQKLEILESTREREYNNFGEFVVRFGDAQRTVAPIATAEPLRNELLDFTDAVAKRRAPLVTGRVGCEVLRVVERIEESLATP